LIWLLLSYGFVLYQAANLIGEGSELLMLVPSMAGLVGGVVLPLLGAVPDGAIILFSGLSPDLAEAQEKLSVGVGALAGSTIMLLTIPFALSIIGGRVDFLEPDYRTPNYIVKPKLTDKHSIIKTLTATGVGISPAVQQGGVLMAITTIPYFLIQIPASFLHGENEEVGQAEKWWALSAFLVCFIGLCIYMYQQLQISKIGEDRDKRVAIMKKMLQQGKMSLSGVVASEIHRAELKEETTKPDYQELDEQNQTSTIPVTTTTTTNAHYPSATVSDLLAELVGDAFKSYDTDGSGHLDRKETGVFFRDFHETISDEEMDTLFQQYDADKSGHIDFHEFIGLAYSLIKIQEQKHRPEKMESLRNVSDGEVREKNENAIAESAFADTEEEEMPEEFTDMSPDEQQRAIIKRAFLLLLAGTVLVLIFSDPIVDVFAEIGTRTGIPPFYVSFVLAPLASNASEVLSTMYYAKKKTRKTITVALTALEGAASMNNTFCLSIFMALIFFRGLAWQYTAETLVIIVVQVIVCFLVQRPILSTLYAILILLIFPFSIALVAGMEALGFD
jgi:Ca2+-binding EF-hand superfamily protein